MSVYKHPKSPFYQYDFVVNGHRFNGSTRTTSKREAIKFEADVRKDAKAKVAARKSATEGALTVDIATGRYYLEVGQHHTHSATTLTDLTRLKTFLGTDKRLAEITDADVVALVAWRRAQPVHGRVAKKNGPPVPAVSPSTVNRSTTQLMKFIFTRAKRTWRCQFPAEPNWRDHMLKEPKERVRELDAPEGEALDAAVRADYALWFEFARLTGLRRNETLIKWSNVNIFAKRITTIGKGGALISTPITPDVAAILKACEGHHKEFVFTYICRRPAQGQTKGQRYPITPEGAKTQWRRLRARANVQDFRFHDIRHDVATKLLRATGNLKIVQRALNHADIKTTTKYAHVLDDEVAAALEQIAKSRKNPRNGKKKQA